MVPSKERTGHQKEPLCLRSVAVGASAVLYWSESSERIKGAPGMKVDRHMAISLLLLRTLGSSFAMKGHSMDENSPSVRYFTALKYLAMI